MYSYWISEYDEGGNLIQETCYDAVTNEVQHYDIYD